MLNLSHTVDGWNPAPPAYPSGAWGLVLRAYQHRRCWSALEGRQSLRNARLVDASMRLGSLVLAHVVHSLREKLLHLILLLTSELLAAQQSNRSQASAVGAAIASGCAINCWRTSDFSSIGVRMTTLMAACCGGKLRRLPESLSVCAPRRSRRSCSPAGSGRISGVLATSPVPAVATIGAHCITGMVMGMAGYVNYQPQLVNAGFLNHQQYGELHVSKGAPIVMSQNLAGALAEAHRDGLPYIVLPLMDSWCRMIPSFIELPSLKRTAKAPEIVPTPGKRRFWTWKPSFLRGRTVSFREGKPRVYLSDVFYMDGIYRIILCIGVYVYDE